MEVVINSYPGYGTTEIAEILGLIEMAGEVNVHTLPDRLMQTRQIATISHGNSIIATASIKSAALSYRQRIFSKSKCELSPDEFPLELGYVSVDEAYKGKRLGKKLCQRLMETFNKVNVFATTREDNIAMQRILEHLHFKRTGIPYLNHNKTAALIIYQHTAMQ